MTKEEFIKLEKYIEKVCGSQIIEGENPFWCRRELSDYISKHENGIWSFQGVNNWIYSETGCKDLDDFIESTAE